jgi:hypothetical protein
MWINCAIHRTFTQSNPTVNTPQASLRSTPTSPSRLVTPPNLRRLQEHSALLSPPQLPIRLHGNVITLKHRLKHIRRQIRTID